MISFSVVIGKAPKDGGDGWGFTLSPSNIAIGDTSDGSLDFTNAKTTVNATYGNSSASAAIVGNLTCSNCAAEVLSGGIVHITSVNTHQISYTYNGTNYTADAYYPNGYVLIPVKGTLGSQNASAVLRLDFTVSGFIGNKINDFKIAKVITDNNATMVAVSEIKQQSDNILLNVSTLNITSYDFASTAVGYGATISKSNGAFNFNIGESVAAWASLYGTATGLTVNADYVAVFRLKKSASYSGTGDHFQLHVKSTSPAYSDYGTSGTDTLDNLSSADFKEYSVKFVASAATMYLSFMVQLSDLNSTTFALYVDKCTVYRDTDTEYKSRMSTIELNAEGIASSVTAETNRATAEESSIRQTANSISLKVSQITLPNLLLGTRSWRGWTSGTALLRAVQNAVGGCWAYYAKKSSSSAEYSDILSMGVNLKPSTTYTFSFWHKGAAVSTFVYPNVNSVSPVDTRNDWGAVTGDVYIRRSVTFTTASTVSATDIKYVLFRTYTTDGCYIAGAALYESPYDIPWNEAPEDIDNKLDDASTNITNEIGNKLFDTGIDITNKKILATANCFEFRNNSGTVTMQVDADGNLTSGTSDSTGVHFGKKKMDDNNSTYGFMEFGNKSYPNIHLGYHKNPLDDNSTDIVPSLEMNDATQEGIGGNNYSWCVPGRMEFYYSVDNDTPFSAAYNDVLLNAEQAQIKIESGNSGGAQHVTELKPTYVASEKFKISNGNSYTDGFTGTFIDNQGHTVTVVGGIITSISN